MATTTPNYGWDVPTSSDYVKQGAVAIETLGDDIDASLFSITSGKNVGLVHLLSTSWGTQTNVSILNIFTSQFLNYYVVGNFIAPGGASCQIRLRDGSGDLVNNYVNNVSSQGGDNRHENGYTANWQNSYFNQSAFHFQFNLLSPFASEKTVIIGSGYADNTLDLVGGQYTPTTSATGFTLFGGFTSGKMKIYGCKD